MTWTTLIAVYLVVWWLTLFIVLPFGVQRANPEDLMPGEDPGSPARPRLLLKFAVTTVAAALIVTAIWFIQDAGLVDFRN